MAANEPITQLDFLQVKENLKTFLSSQDRFKDYDFEGSNMNVLLDVLAYNTFQNNFYTNMAFSEMFLDSAQLRESVVSHAKALNYLPRSRSSSRAVINVKLNVADSPAFITVPAKTQFRAVCGNKTYNFYNTEPATVYPFNNNYIFFGLEIFEGTYVTETFVVNGNPKQRFVLSNNTVDTSSIKVTIKENISDTVQTEYTRKASVFGINSTDEVYYVQAAESDKYEVTFGTNRFGKQPITGNVITVEYRITAGEEANGITGYASAANISGYPTSVTLVSTSTGGAERESADSIKFFTPKALQVQDRAITQNDYEIILQTAFPEIRSVLAYGGEFATPPQYGKVIISVQQQDNKPLTTYDANRYRQYIDTKSPIGIEPLIRSAEYMHVEVDTIVTYDSTNYSKREPDLRQSVNDAVLSYSANSLESFKSSFMYSKFVSAIDNADPAVVSNETYTRAIIEIAPQTGVSTNIKFSFENELKPNADSALRAVQSTVPNHPFIPLLQLEKISRLRPALTSSLFTYNGTSAYIQDDATGVLNVINVSTTGRIIYLKRNIGTVNYDTGQVTITGLVIDSYTGGKIKMYGVTDTSNIISPKTRIITIRPEDIKITMIKQ